MTTSSAVADREVLIRLFEATGGKSWNKRSGWAKNKGVGDWFGVTANAEGQVVGLNLTSNNLRGAIPKELVGFEALETLVLSYNSLTGEIPRELGDLKSVKWISLSGNKLSGAIPKELGGLEALKTLDLENNSLTGEIPRELGHLKSVKWIFLSRNKLSGKLSMVYPFVVQFDLVWWHQANNRKHNAHNMEIAALPIMFNLFPLPRW